jgi:RNA recognition motif-containing protein
MASRLFIGSLSWDTSDESLRAFFEQAGTVQSAEVARDRYTGKSKGFGFVEMGSDDEAQKAIKDLNGRELDGRSINVDEARPPRERSERRY